LLFDLNRREAGSIEFIHTRIFDRLWQKLGLNDDDLADLQQEILANPKRWPVIAGAGGARKLRVIYCDLGKFVILALVYPKGTKDDLSADETKAIRRAILEIEEELGT
jgi:hypothetical protein